MNHWGHLTGEVQPPVWLGPVRLLRHLDMPPPRPMVSMKGRVRRAPRWIPWTLITPSTQRLFNLGGKDGCKCWPLLEAG